MFCYWQNKKLKLTYFEVDFLVSLIGGFLGGFTPKNPLGFYGYAPGCLNPADEWQAERWVTEVLPDLICNYQPRDIINTDETVLY